MWDDRYSTNEYVYGKEPNDFLKASAALIPPGPVLSLAEGEGRNAVFLAGRGYDVTAVDASAVGLEKARRLAEERGVRIQCVQADLEDFRIAPTAWSGIVSIFCHLPPVARASLHRACVTGLAPGGVYVLEAYTPRQRAYGTGGPASAELLVEPDALRVELEGLLFDRLEEVVRPVIEGICHRGAAAVVQAIARKPRGVNPAG